MPLTRKQSALRITWIGFIANALLSITKILAGIFGQSSAMLADGIHSLSDLLSDSIVLFGFQLANRPIDHSHDYGHGKFETLSAASIGLILIFVAAGLFFNGGKEILRFYKGKPLPTPHFIAFIMAPISIIVKEILFRITLSTAKKINSDALKANAWHHRSDMFSSLATLFGIGGAFLFGNKWAVLDPIASLVVSLLIVKVGISVIHENLLELTEASLSYDVEKEILKIASSVKGVYEPHHLKTRKIGPTIAIDMDIRVKKELSVTQGHAICTEVENALRKRFGKDIFVRIHMEPLIGVKNQND